MSSRVLLFLFNYIYSGQEGTDLISTFLAITVDFLGWGNPTMFTNQRRCSFPHSSTPRGRYDRSLHPTAALGSHVLVTTLPSWASDNAVRCIWYSK
ncbi:hypothetical protein CGRA01v4_10236 [Colletotrichum graminicola]|nr:hypothetical protein CGRA01v4_10236 [Colletotrichum graminicola]